MKNENRIKASHPKTSSDRTWIEPGIFMKESDISKDVSERIVNTVRKVPLEAALELGLQQKVRFEDPGLKVRSSNDSHPNHACFP